MKINEHLYIDPFGIIRFELGGKILLLFIVEFLAIWVSFMILSSWDIFRTSNQGKAILGLNIFFLVSVFNSIVMKNRFLSFYVSEVAKQFSNIIFFVNIFLILFYYNVNDFQENGSTIEYYYNPAGMTYIFILTFMVCFYVICNSHK